MTGWDAVYAEAERRGPSLLLSRAMSLVEDRGSHRTFESGAERTTEWSTTIEKIVAT